MLPNSHLQLTQLNLPLPDIFFYLLIPLISILFLVFLLIVNNRRKRQSLKQVYQKLSDSDKQIFHVVTATEKRTIPTIQNITMVFQNINNQKIQPNRLIQCLYRLENVGLVKISVASWEGQDVQISRALYSNRSIAESISLRYRFFSSFFLPLALISIGLCYYLLQFVDLLVNVDLYGYGLIFSYDWANQYWNITSLMRSSFIVLLFLLILSLILTIINFYHFRNSIRNAICFLFAIGIFITSYSVFLLSQIDFIINHDLYLFGLQFTYQWAEIYWMYSGLIIILLGLSISSIVVCLIFCSFAKSIN